MNYTLSIAAEEDIFDIALYTAEQWGAKQTRIYTEQLADCMEKLATKQGAFKQLTEFNPPIRVKHCKHHYLFGQDTKDTFLILAVLHERMDFMTHLHLRLGD